ncbi:MAG: hypothetical protein ACFWUA_07415 [Sporanaerobacter sp.]|jgi:hypothetical protein
MELKGTFNRVLTYYVVQRIEGGIEMNRNYRYEDLEGSDSSLARAYVPFQFMNQVYSKEEALKRGTLFPELYRPYKYSNRY